ncbi:hypothetical protein ALC60_11767 [Trachymyrmex zeteki]|uniref:Uncharacterized protein n=1 Tax=Mycetomoellerius zeteki TaxID=64791 RepID=A0A151WMU0_9HYME|nr:hypothetical protein ALC60_11767 [Trachymyrmex zeteki]
MVPRFPLSRSGKGWRGATSTTPRWRGTFSLIHPVLRKRTTQALTSPERSIDLAPCRLGGIVATPRRRLAFSKGKEKEKKIATPVTISFAAVVTSDGRNVTSVPASQSESFSRDRRDASLGAKRIQNRDAALQSAGWSTKWRGLVRVADRE